jgi:hypothetical protein
VEIIHKQISKFQTDWLDLQVEPERFQVNRVQEPFGPLKDFVVRTFRELLSHTPITRLGINRHVHFDAGTQEARDKIGYALAPPDAWGEWASLIKSGEGDRRGGMISIVMRQKDLDDRPCGYVQATVQPSIQIPGNSGVYVDVNDHFEVPDPARIAGSEEIITLLESRFEGSIRRSEWIIDQVMRINNG